MSTETAIVQPLLVSCVAKKERFIIVSVTDTVFVNVYLPVCTGDVHYQDELQPQPATSQSAMPAAGSLSVSYFCCYI